MKEKNATNIIAAFIAALLIAAASIRTTAAYIDPGTGGSIIGSISPIVAAVFAAIGAFFARYLIKPTKRLFKMIFGKKDETSKTGTVRTDKKKIAVKKNPDKKKRKKRKEVPDA